MARLERMAVLLMVALFMAGAPALARPQGDAAAAKPAPVPVTNVPLGRFPYFGWPAEFAPQNTPITRRLGHFFFWTGDVLRDVEGQTFLVTLVGAGGDFNEYLVKKTMQTQFARAGAVKIAASHIPSEVLRRIPQVDRQNLGAGMGDPYNNSVETWLIQRPDRQIWVQYTDNSAQASLAVVETDPANPTGDTDR